ncbi:MAG: GYD domain-containing protein [Bacteroidales bacterium]|nr:GYD domain-containing protein [Bacteroidales bacterium]
MATYFLFGKYSAEAIKGISPGRTEKANKLIRKFGGKIEAIYALTGDKDLVIIAAFPNAEKAVMASVAVSKLTGIAFTTSEAIPVEKFDKMIAEIP